MRKARAGRVDIFPNRAMFSVQQSAANALSFTQIRFGMGIFQGTALIISRILWYLGTGIIDELTAGTDSIQMALTNRDDLASLDPVNMNVLIQQAVHVADFGTAASGQFVESPIISDFASLPGGGLIYPANPLFIGVDSLGFANAQTLYAIMYYLTKELADAEYVELVQSLIPVNI